MAAACPAVSLVPWTLGKTRPMNGPGRPPAMGSSLGSRMRRACRSSPFMSMVIEAVRGVKREVIRQKSLHQRVIKGVSLSLVLVREVAALFLAVPYGLHAFAVFASLPRKDPADCNGDLPGSSSLEMRPIPKDFHPWLLSFLRLLSSISPPLVKKALGLARFPLPPAKGQEQGLGQHSVRRVSMVQDVRYGPAERNVLDIYLPHSGSASAVARRDEAGNVEPLSAGSASTPVLLFVHGGVWASGEKWQYAPMAVQCAQHGVVAVVIQYSLYPEVLSCKQAEEASQALSWTLDNIRMYGGDPGRVYLAGHSSGAHICALAMWRRACAGLRDSSSSSPLQSTAASAQVSKVGNSQEEVDVGAQSEVRREGNDGEDSRQPLCFLGLSGVYDIACHLSHEVKRGVDIISCMTPANGSCATEFALRSPALLVGALAALHSAQGTGNSSLALGQPTEDGVTDVGGKSSPSLPLPLEQGTSHAERGLFGKASAASASVEADLKKLSFDLSNVAVLLGDSLSSNSPLDASTEAPCGPLSNDDAAAHRLLKRKLVSLILGNEDFCDSDVEPLSRPLSQLRQHFPQTVLMCSPGDVVVPPDTSISFAAALQSLQLPCTVLAYDEVGHGDFACWSADWSRSSMPAHVCDMLQIVQGKATEADMCSAS